MDRFTRLYVRMLLGNVPRSSKGRTPDFEFGDAGSNPALGAKPIEAV